MRISKKKVGLVALATVAISSSLAYAYWTGDGSGTGEAATADSIAPLTINQTSVVTGLGPGIAPKLLEGNFTNPNTGPVFVGTVTVSIAGVTKDPDAVAGSCDASDYLMTGAAMSVDTDVAPGTNVGSWSGATIRFNNKPVNQDACKGATVNLAYTLS
jgi:hypothetical protein